MTRQCKHFFMIGCNQQKLLIKQGCKSFYKKNKSNTEYLNNKN